jgi:predicted Zn-dependent peptidase
MDVRKLVLPNGMTVLALEDHSVPSVAYYTLFKVGSRNERPGITGLSHMFEHMMFNGSARFAPKQFDRLIEAGGGSSNAFTTADTTEYFEEFSSAVLPTVIALEADRVRALRLDRENLEQERGIVKEERRSNTDASIVGSMQELLWNTAFLANGYHWDTIGFMRDLDAIRLEDAKEYFRVFYAPNNAVTVVVGDFDTQKLFAQMRAAFADVRPGPRPPRVVNAEPAQNGERRSLLHRVAELPAVLFGFKVPAMRHRDVPALRLLASILGSGESSRLYRQLVYEKQIASEVSVDLDSRIDAGLLTFYVQAGVGHTAEECEAAVMSALKEVAEKGVSQRELEKALNGIRVQHADAMKTNLGRAGLLAQREALWGGWETVSEIVPRHERVTAAEVRRAAQTYLSVRKKTTVVLVPEKLK